MQPDPVGLSAANIRRPGSLNRYAYMDVKTKNSPILYPGRSLYFIRKLLKLLDRAVKSTLVTCGQQALAKVSEPQIAGR